jgi:signal peptidase I
LPFSLPLIEGRIFARLPERGDVAVFKLPSDNRTDYIKRVVGLPGDRIAVKDGYVVRNGVQQREAYIRPCGGGPECNLHEITVPKDHYFMMGDNRGASDDSRFWGPVPRDWIIGQAFLTYWPPDRIGFF